MSTVLLIIVIIILIFFIPKINLLKRYRTGDKKGDKIIVEDALKHLYDFESKKIDATQDSVAGNLQIKRRNSASLINRLLQLKLITKLHEKISLTEKGRNYALKVIRIHRLYERYLAEKTSVHENDWHKEAEKREHDFDEDYADKLAASLGNPLLDPHGDPIPDASGKMPLNEGILLSDAEVGKVYEICHVEDEPKEIYAQIIAQKLFPGTKLKILEKDDHRISFESDNDESILAPVLAANITLIPREDKADVFRINRLLSSLNQGEISRIKEISKAIRGLQRRRLLDFGFVPGTEIKANLVGLGGDPVAYEVRGTVVALRKNISQHIYIE
ncbi:MAG: iron dependent repressor, metal binding and dimerization domain protein [Melioribacteraceae bacterium]